MMHRIEAHRMRAEVTKLNVYRASDVDFDGSNPLQKVMVIVNDKKQLLFGPFCI